MSTSLILPMAAHVVLTALLYVLLTLARAPAVWRLRRLPGGADAWRRLEPRIGANLSNQFEWPLFFHVACLLHLVLAQESLPGAVLLAWVFVGGRVLHSAVQIGTANVRLRGLVFTVNFLAALGLWAMLLIAMKSIEPAVPARPLLLREAGKPTQPRDIRGESDAIAIECLHRKSAQASSATPCGSQA